MKIGAHVSTAGSLDKAIDRAIAIGAEAIQIFGSAPQSWREKGHTPAECDDFKRRSKETGVGPAFLHGIYLMNFATASPSNLQKSILSLTSAQEVCHAIGARGAIFHVGSHKGMGYDAVFKQVCDSLSYVLDQTPADTWLIIENSAGMGNTIGSRFEEIGRIVKAIASDRAKVCIDTCHCYVSGYNIATAKGIDEVMEEFEREIGWERLVAVHANDCKAPFESGLDRHENIGQGHIGIKGFEVIMAHSAFQNVPFFLEVPGMEGGGPDKANVDILKEIRSRVGAKA